MKVDVSSILKIAGAKVGVNGHVNFKSADFLGESYVFEEPLAVNGEIYNNGQTLTLEARVTGKMITECARCLSDVHVDVDFDIEEYLARDDGSERKDDEEDMILFDGHEVELDDIIRDRFLMNLSGKYLCRVDCKGLCPVCGHNLNEGDCGCEKDYIDPRWQALADIMKRQNEDESSESND